VHLRWLACAALTAVPAAAQEIDPARDGGIEIMVTARPLLNAGEDIVRLPARHASDGCCQSKANRSPHDVGRSLRMAT
jgi:hypothetical protein